MIHLHNVEKIYPPDQVALRGLELKVGAGDFLFIAGASGAGKSTLLKLLYGAEKASKGEVIICGRNLSASDDSGLSALRRSMGMVFQDYKLLPRRTILDNVAFGLEVRGIPLKDRRRSAHRLLEVLGLGDRTGSYPQFLSGGEQQRVAIARALIHKPQFVLADEPTGNLDPEMSRIVFDLLLEANAAGVTVVVATHDLAMIESLGLRTVVLDRGRIIGDFGRASAMSR